MMLTILFVLCLSLLDVMKPPIADELGKQFVVRELQEQATTGCTTSPQAGRPSNHQIFIDVVNNDDPHDGATPVSSLQTSNYDAAMDGPTVPAMMPYDPPGPPKPETPPVTAVPEPPMLAILGMSLAVLFYLVFGRQKKQRLYRRIS